jgi:branched-chain amino acid transport system permease protein
MVFCALLGILIEKAAYKPLRQKPSVVFLSAGIGACLGFFASVFFKWNALLPAAAGCASCGLIGLLIEKNVRVHAVILISSGIGLAAGIFPALIWPGGPFFPVLPVMLFSFPLFSWAVYLYHKRPFKAAPRIAYLITAIGVSLFLEYAMMYWQTPAQKYFPPILKDIPIEIKVSPENSIFIFSQHIIFFSSAVVLSVLLWILVKFTRIGRGMRAVSFDAEAAKLMGVNVNNTISFTFAVGSALAGAAGVLFGAFYPFDPLLGIMPGLKAFIAAVLGGIGSLPGAMLGGILMGIAEQLSVGFGNSSLRDVTAFIILIVILMIKPGGLLGRGTNDKV